MLTLNKITTFIVLTLGVVYTYFAGKFSTMLVVEYGMPVDMVYPTEMTFVIGFWLLMVYVLYRVITRKF